MLTQVIVQNASSMTFDVEAVDPDAILIVKSISGLSSVGFDLHTGDYAQGGSYYQGRRASKRNPVFNFKLNPDYANDIEVSDIREMLYDLFTSNIEGLDFVYVILKDDRKPDRYITAYTEKIETNMFDRNQTVQVSTLCTHPNLLSVDMTEGENPSGWSYVPLEYDGSAEAGIYYEVEVMVATPVVNVLHSGLFPGGAPFYQYMVFSHPYGNFSVGDTFRVSTVKGNLSVTLNMADGLNYMLPASAWIALNKYTTGLQSSGTVVDDGKAKITKYQFRSEWRGI